MTDKVLTAYTRALTGMIDRTVECFELLNEVRALEAELELERSRRCLGGTPPGYSIPGAWAYRAIAPPPSASDKNAPPLKRGLS